MNCDAAEELISELIDGELPEATRSEVEAHIDACERCGPLAKQMQRTVRFVRTNSRTMLTPNTPGGNYMEFTRALVDDAERRTGEDVGREKCIWKSATSAGQEETS